MHTSSFWVCSWPNSEPVNPARFNLQRGTSDYYRTVESKMVIHTTHTHHMVEKNHLEPQKLIHY